MEIRDEELKDTQGQTTEDEYEKYCFVCRRPQSKAGKMITMMEGMYICPDCMQKTMDAVSASPLNLEKYTENSDDLEMPKGPNISMINLADLQSLMPPRKKVKKKKTDKNIFPRLDFFGRFGAWRVQGYRCVRALVERERNCSRDIRGSGGLERSSAF